MDKAKVCFVKFENNDVIATSSYLWFKVDDNLFINRMVEDIHKGNGLYVPVKSGDPVQLFMNGNKPTNDSVWQISSKDSFLTYDEGDNIVNLIFTGVTPIKESDAKGEQYNEIYSVLAWLYEFGHVIGF